MLTVQANAVCFVIPVQVNAVGGIGGLPFCMHVLGSNHILKPKIYKKDKIKNEKKKKQKNIHKKHLTDMLLLPSCLYFELLHVDTCIS